MQGLHGQHGQAGLLSRTRKHQIASCMPTVYHAQSMESGRAHNSQSPMLPQRSKQCSFANQATDFTTIITCICALDKCDKQVCIASACEPHVHWVISACHATHGMCCTASSDNIHNRATGQTSRQCTLVHHGLGQPETKHSQTTNPSRTTHTAPTCPNAPVYNKS